MPFRPASRTLCATTAALVLSACDGRQGEEARWPVEGASKPLRSAESNQPAAPSASEPVAVSEDDSQTLYLAPVPELEGATGSTAINKGEPPEVGAFPTVFWGGNCTATLVGPQTLLTAAHCIDNRLSGMDWVPNKLVVERTRQDKTLYAWRWTTACLIPDVYRNSPPDTSPPEDRRVRHPSDIALCYLNRPVDARALRPERLSDLPVKKGDAVLLIGAGCSKVWRKPGPRPKCMAEDKDDKGTVRVGDEVIQAVSGPSLRTAALTSSDEPTLCPGDSGGPAMTGASTKDQFSSARRVRGVNSAMDCERPGSIESIFASLASDEFRQLKAAYLATYPNALCLETGGPGCGD